MFAKRSSGFVNFTLHHKKVVQFFVFTKNIRIFV